MDDWSLNSLGNVSAIQTTSSLSGGGRESDLIISDDMDGSIDVIVIEVGHLKTLINNSLTSYSSITVNNNTQSTSFVSKSILDCLNMSHNNWISCL